MQRIHRIDRSTAPRKTAELLATVERQMGLVPNILGTMAQSAAALGGYLGFAGALAAGTLTASLREQIALAVAGANRCDYCASVHTALGGRAGLGADELQRNLTGHSADERVAAALALSRRIVETRGNISDQDLAAARSAGFSDEQIVEVLAVTVLNIFTNYFNHLAGTEIDFPVVRTADVVAA